ncbi:GtrA family protein [Atlantibacter sp.]|uniref:GtrA family protein n=1 Tax=Atlantibacter sp. TaxID=1903473 RepID=UPI0028AB260C|nr:GtrA family protein [Atlantibacter sp.]
MLYNFKIYTLIGILNTVIHWFIFFTLHSFGYLQSTSNTIAFIISASFSYFMNSRFNFKKEMNGLRYLFFISGLGLISYYLGHIADCISLNVFFTLIIFSLVSLVMGFLYSKYLVFK